MALCASFAGALYGLPSPWIYAGALLGVAVVCLLVLLGSAPGGRVTFRHSIDRGLMFWLAAALFFSAAALCRGILIPISIAQNANSSSIAFFVAVLVLGSLSLFSLSLLKGGIIDATGIALRLAVGFLLTFQVLLLIAGVNHANVADFPQARAQSTSMAAIGMDMLRWQMPLTTGTNGGAVFGMLGVIFGASYFSKKTLIPSLALLFLGVFVLLAVDSRTALAAAFAAPMAVYLLRRHPRLLALTAISLPIVPLLIVFGADYMPSEIMSLASARAATYGMFSGREDLWRLAVFNLPTMDLELLFGFGNLGHVTSGVVGSYNHILATFGGSTRDLATLHNGYVQLFLDTGLVGLLVFTVFLYKLVACLAVKSRADEEASRLWRALCATVVALLFVAGTESSLAPYIREPFAALILVAGIAAFFGRRSAPMLAAPSASRHQHHPLAHQWASRFTL